MRALGQGLSAALLLAIAVASVAGEAGAACATPSGVAGQMQFISSEMKFCDGTDWQSMKGAAVAGGCAKAGLFQYVADSDFTWCDGAALWSAKSSTALGACGANGTSTWDSTSSVVKGCIGGTWYSLKPVVAAGDHGSIIEIAPGSYSHTFTSAATVTLAYLKGGGGGGAECDANWAMNGVTSTLKLNGTTLASATGGSTGNAATCGSPSAGSGSNSIGGVNGSAGGAGGADCGGGGADGGNGGSVTGGSFAVASGDVLVVTVGAGGSGACGYNGGFSGSVSLSW